MCICMATGRECHRIFQMRIERENENLLLLIFYLENSLHDTYVCIIVQYINIYSSLSIKKVPKIV